MAIVKTAKNMFVQVNCMHNSLSKTLVKTADYLNIQTTTKILILTSNKKVCTKGLELEDPYIHDFED